MLFFVSTKKHETQQLSVKTDKKKGWWLPMVLLGSDEPDFFHVQLKRLKKAKLDITTPIS